MQRGEIGRYEVTSAGGEHVRAFVPAPLPPVPALALDGFAAVQLLEAASLGLGRLDAISVLLPDDALFLYAYVRKEAALSSQIEGTQSSLSDLLLFELDEAPGVPLNDVTEVSNYVAALRARATPPRRGLPIVQSVDPRDSWRGCCHSGTAATQIQASSAAPRIGSAGTRPGNAAFVPPPHTIVPDCMAAFERFLHDREDGLPMV